MKILIVSGFLGSGKTTFINKLMQVKKNKYLILENEYANVNIDAELLENDREKIWEMTEGCVCCSMNQDIAETVLTISNTYDTEFLLIEPSGVGKLSNIIKSVSKVCYQKIKLLPAISLVDASVFLKNFKQKDPNYIDQIKYAKYILITKTANLRIEEIIGIKKIISKLNNNACCLIANDIKDDDQFWDKIIGDNFEDITFDFSQISNKNTEFESISFKNISEHSITDFVIKLNLILRGNFGEIVRIKGFLPINKQWTKVDSVGIEYKLETIKPKLEAKLVIIGKNLKKNYLEDMFVNNQIP